jgi:hypothetical protein
MMQVKSVMTAICSTATDALDSVWSSLASNAQVVQTTKSRSAMAKKVWTLLA